MIHCVRAREPRYKIINGRRVGLRVLIARANQRARSLAVFLSASLAASATWASVDVGRRRKRKLRDAHTTILLGAHNERTWQPRSPLKTRSQLAAILIFEQRRSYCCSTQSVEE